VKITTKSKFTCDVNPEKVKDWRFIKALAKMDSGNEDEILVGTAFAVPFLFGDKGEADLIEFATDKDGIAQTGVIIEEFRDVMAKLGEESKKSQSSQE
jgi:hypothetical protein